MKCKTKNVMVDPKMTVTKRGGNMLKGECSECGCTMCKICPKNS